MNIILNKYFYFSVLILFLNTTIFSQNNSGFKIDIAGGYTYSMYNKGSFEFGDYSRKGVCGGIRALWQSDNMLGIGIESGYLPLASLKEDNFTNEFGTSNIRANINAFPLFADFLFDFDKFFFNASLGYYYINSRINAFGEKSSSHSFDFGFSFCAGYKFIVRNNINIGAELKSHHLIDTPQLAFVLQIFCSINLSQ